MSGVLTENEKKATLRYSELTAATGGRITQWRNVIFRNKVINSYWNKSFIRYIFTQPIVDALPPKGECMIAEFGCGLGNVAETVVSQIIRPSNSRITPIGIDICEYDLKKMQERSRKMMERRSPNFQPVQPVRGDLRSLPFKPDTFHAGILRFTLPFIRKYSQCLVLKQIFNTLKPGAILVILNDGVLHETEVAKTYNKLFVGHVTAARLGTDGERLPKPHFTSCEILKVMAERAGFTVKAESDLTDAVTFGYTSAGIYGNACRLTVAQIQYLNTVYDKCEQEGILSSVRNSCRVQHPLYTLKLQKPPSP